MPGLGARAGLLASTIIMSAAVSDVATAQSANTADGVQLPQVTVTSNKKTKATNSKPKKSVQKSSDTPTQAPQSPSSDVTQPELPDSASDITTTPDVSSDIQSAAQRSPSSSSVLTRSEITKSGVGSVQDVARHTPNAVLSDQGSPRFTVNAIRGIGTTVRDDYFTSSLGVFVDGVPATSAEYSRRLGDVESVEVLRGPQGVLFGSNTAAGAINITTRAPTDIPAAEVQGTIGNNGQRGGSAYLSGPLAGRALTGRAFFDYVERDGFTDYATSGKSIDDLQSATGSASLQYRPDSNFTAVLSGTLEHADQGAYAYQPYNLYKLRVANITPPNEEVRDSRSLSANMTYNFGDTQLRSISGYRDYDVSASQDLNYNLGIVGYGGGRTESEEDGRQLSQEFRLSGHASDMLRWTAGAFYQNTTFAYEYFYGVPAFGNPTILSDYDRSEIAFYGEGTASLTRNLDVTAGVRYTHEEHEFSNNYGLSGEQSYNLLTPKLALAYHFDSDRQVYVSATRGARSGGFNRMASSLIAGTDYDPEYLWSYEAGLKSEWLGKSVTFNATAFYIDWTDQQVRTVVSPGVIRIDNAGQSHSKGFEFEGRWRPIQGMELAGFLGVTHGEYDEYVDRFGVDLAGKTLVNTPELTAGLSAEYRWPVENTGLFAFVRGDYLYTGDQYFDANNRLEQKGYGLVNLRAGLEAEKFSVMLFAKNLFDKDYRSYGYRDFEGSALASDIAIAGESRLVGLTATWRY